MFRVTDICEWPSVSMTTRGLTPWASSSVAHECRRSCSRMSGNFAAASRALNCRVTCRGSSGVPIAPSNEASGVDHLRREELTVNALPGPASAAAHLHSSFLVRYSTWLLPIRACVSFYKPRRALFECWHLPLRLGQTVLHPSAAHDPRKGHPALGSSRRAT